MMTKPRPKVISARLRIIYMTLTMIVFYGMLITPLVATEVMAQSQFSKPTAVIDGTFHVYINHTAYLDGTFSSGQGNLDYQWTLESSPPGSIASLEDSTEAEASLTPDVLGTYRVKLVVTSNLVDSDPAYATITVTKHPYMW
jgi:hypothetical protein